MNQIPWFLDPAAVPAQNPCPDGVPNCNCQCDLHSTRKADLHTIQYKSRYEQGALDVFATSFGSEEALARDPRHLVRLGGSEGPAESVPPRPSPQCTSASGARRRFELPPLSLPGACAAIAGYARTNAGQETTLARAGHASRPRPLSRKSLPIGLERV